MESTSTVRVLTVRSVNSRKWCGRHCMQYIADKETVANKMAASLELSFSYKGKEYLFVEETRKTLEALQCPVCFKIVLEPVQISGWVTWGMLVTTRCKFQANSC